MIKFYSYLKRINEPLSKLIIKIIFTEKGMMQKKTPVHVNLKTQTQHYMLFRDCTHKKSS